MAKILSEGEIAQALGVTRQGLIYRKKNKPVDYRLMRLYTLLQKYKQYLKDCENNFVVANVLEEVSEIEKLLKNQGGWKR